MLMVSIETGVLRANICRYVAEWGRKNRIGLVSYGICPISKYMAGYYTTNPKCFQTSFSGQSDKKRNDVTGQRVKHLKP